ncbi:MAG TPA: hypothetical protein VGA67_04105 [Candidatus Dojkabacteria bacterium]|jgi:hypothetical protein
MKEIIENNKSEILSVIAIAISFLGLYYSRKKEQIKAKLYVGFDYSVFPSKKKEKYIGVIIYNVGLRDIYFKWPFIYYTSLSKKGVMVLAMAEIGQEKEYMLKPGESKAVYFINNFTNEENTDIKSMIVEDQLGNKYIFPVASRLKRLISFLRLKLRK